MEIHWVSEHIGVAGNQKVDTAPKEVAEKSDTRQCVERFVTLAHVDQKITESKWKENKHWFRSSYDKQGPLQTARYDSSLVTQGQNQVIMVLSLEVSRRYFQLKSGFTITAVYLCRIGKVESNRFRV